MSQSAIDKLIINSPFEEPQQYWSYNREYRTFELKEGRRPAGYVIASEGSKSFDDPGVFVEIPLVNQIRPRVKAWREAGYPGVTGITKRLLEYWNAPEERDFRRFFFCQLEAIETVIWLVEAPGAEKVGIDIPSDGGNFTRLCCKMATGSGKTVVMALLIAWQILNKATYPQDTRFSKNIFIVAPGLTVKSRLQVLLPYGKGNYYDEFDVVPSGLREKLRQGKVLVRNWHALNWDTEEQVAKKRSVDKRGAKSDEAYVREVLGEMASARNIVVLNDEAHHAWRVPAESKVKGVKKEEIEEATKWVGGLDRIHTARGLLNCFDFSATPFAPSGKKAAREALFEWIVSDFGLNDAIESGLVKTPRVVIRDDGKLTKEYRSRFYHIYNDPDVKNDITRRAEEREPLPSLLINAYDLLGKDWWETAKKWRDSGHTIPPVMITVANRTETAARVKHAFDHKKTQIEALCDPERTIHIDSKVLEMAESQEEGFTIGGEPEQAESENAPKKKLTKKEAAELLRQTVDTVGKQGQPGEQVQNVISVGMLSEGWDAKTVTHIMGLRAFSSQLLCEQVVGRGLRRTSYDINRETGLFDAEYVNIFGVPFTFLPHESTEDTIPPPPPARTAIEPLKAKEAFEIRWPNLLRVEHVYRPTLTLNSKKVNPLRFNAYDVSLIADLALILEGKPDITKVADIDLNKIASQLARMQKIIFRATVEVFEQMRPEWRASKEMLLAQLFQIVQNFLNSKKIQITPRNLYNYDVRRRILLMYNMNKIVQHLWEAIRFENTEAITPIFDPDYPIRSTSDMRTWYTSKPCEFTKKSHINFCVFDSTWEASEAFEFDRNPNVDAWVKNDHLGFEIHYIWQGVVKKYRPDFIIRLINGNHLILETKGMDTQRDKTKRKFLDEWVKAVNSHGGFGK
ncbi:MAG: BPTD_3080 family restriction endonuclease [bacterium]